jgi:hypothetical protein
MAVFTFDQLRERQNEEKIQKAVDAMIWEKGGFGCDDLQRLFPFNDAVGLVGIAAVADAADAAEVIRSLESFHVSGFDLDLKKVSVRVRSSTVSEVCSLLLAAR